MTGIGLVLTAAIVMAASGFPALFLPRRGLAGQRVATALMCAGAACGLAGTALALSGGGARLDLYWGLPAGSFTAEVDPVSAFFLVLALVVPALASVYGLGYWRQDEHAENGRRLGLAFGMLSGAMVLVLVARDGVLFLVAWEVMALAAWFAATAENDRPEVRKAGWTYLVATHIGTLCLFAMFALWQRETGSFALDAPAALGAKAQAWIFALAAIGFGFKAGIMPLHVWLPGAHANAPSHVSAVMSGVMLKMGVYGIVRMTGLLPAPADWMGLSLLGAGALGGIAGIALATGQRDLKRSLAYSSVENIGIITMGLGLALLGRPAGRPEWIVLGLGGALLHSWNHGLFKSLLFLGAGSVIHATGTREVDRLGGLGKSMPLTAALFTLGAVAISGLPPLNGFAGEWLLYLGFLGAAGPGLPVAGSAAALGAVALAAIGAVAVACFVRLSGGLFLGAPRSEAARHAHDPSWAMRLPMLALAAGCLVLGFAPGLASPLLEAAASAWSGAGVGLPALAGLAPQAWLGWLGLALVLAAGAGALAIALSPRARKARRAPTWDCGYAAPTARMEYTASSFGDTVVSVFSFILRPSRRKPRIEGEFPAAAAYRGSQPDPVLDRAVRPAFARGRRRIPAIRVIQQGQTQLYILYILIIATILLIAGTSGARP